MNAYNNRPRNEMYAAQRRADGEVYGWKPSTLLSNAQNGDFALITVHQKLVNTEGHRHECAQTRKRNVLCHKPAAEEVRNVRPPDFGKKPAGQPANAH